VPTVINLKTVKMRLEIIRINFEEFSCSTWN